MQKIRLVQLQLSSPVFAETRLDAVYNAENRLVQLQLSSPVLAEPRLDEIHLPTSETCRKAIGCSL